MTEEDARQKWCPFARTYDAYGNPSHNRNELGDPSKRAMCIGSACMAWRETNVHHDAEVDRKDLRAPKGEINPPFSNCPPEYRVMVCDSEGFYVAEKMTKPKWVETAGYCGLAGKP